ncbi:prepilin peptidase [Saccharobesus litoralis]|uniref:Protein translocase subunit SecA n=1 Tax=Saccharobesus litoralis TaxID=2172099 RepID=A0A2S0VSR9_9ALTE|nr:DEAD/DEAH box helicase [Saccharobesus litoralis]AWB67266.1 prepilin peptidase [Saccharobesus litoralis]
MGFVFPRRHAQGRVYRSENKSVEPSWLDSLYLKIKYKRNYQAENSAFHQFANEVLQQDERLSKLTNDALQQRIVDIKKRVAHGLSMPVVIDVFALIRESARRTLGMAHYPAQLQGGFAILTGHVAEMATGEGKTLVATLPAITAALAGIKVHVISVNDYLTERDASEMMSLYHSFGLTVGIVIAGQNKAKRQLAYQTDIVYCTNTELTFDYLKDRILLAQQTHAIKRAAAVLNLQDVSQQLLLDGLHFAIVDEADSVLVDEARTPLIISGKSEVNQAELAAWQLALQVAKTMQISEHFVVHTAAKQVELTAAGSMFLNEYVDQFQGIWAGRLRREALVQQALVALHLFTCNKDYIVIKGKVQIVDEHTGRVMPDRSWSQGIQQLIELKEQCEVTPPNVTLAKINYPAFFTRFHYWGGMSGTVKEVASEFGNTYQKTVVGIPKNKPDLRQYHGQHLFCDLTSKYLAIAALSKRLSQAGQPVLIGTSSVENSEKIADYLSSQGVEYQLLNAKQDAQEAYIISQAGQAGKVTIATSMAGRGTDIKLNNLSRQAGGLFVIVTELQEASRIDRQLIGRCARQGDPGAYSYFISLEDDLLTQYMPSWKRWLLTKWLKLEKWQTSRFLFWLIRQTQVEIEQQHFNTRRKLQKNSRQQQELLTFAGEE